MQNTIKFGVGVKIQTNVLLAPYTTFGIGGPAKYFAEPESIEEIQELCDWARQKARQDKKEVPVFVLGGGSNILISDKGFNGLVIRNRSNKIEGKKNRVYADSGVLLSRVVQESIKNGLAGMEWAIGIPGTVGGAVSGNAGACGKQTSEALLYVKVLDLKKLSIKKFKNPDCDFYYRDSIFKRGRDFVVLEAVFGLKKEKDEKIKEKIKYYAKERAGSGSRGDKCAGCFFKNIDWKRKDINKKDILYNFPELKRFADKPKISAGFLIEHLEMKSKKMGDATVSDKHANFILNSGNATADEIMMLVALIKNRVYSHYGFGLEEEVQLIGFD